MILIRANHVLFYQCHFLFINISIFFTSPGFFTGDTASPASGVMHRCIYARPAEPVVISHRDMSTFAWDGGRPTLLSPNRCDNPTGRLTQWSGPSFPITSTESASWLCEKAPRFHQYPVQVQRPDHRGKVRQTSCDAPDALPSPSSCHSNPIDIWKYFLYSWSNVYLYHYGFRVTSRGYGIDQKVISGATEFIRWRTFDWSAHKI